MYSSTSLSIKNAASAICYCKSHLFVYIRLVFLWHNLSTGCRFTTFVGVLYIFRQAMVIYHVLFLIFIIQIFLFSISCPCVTVHYSIYDSYVFVCFCYLKVFGGDFLCFHSFCLEDSLKFAYIQSLLGDVSTVNMLIFCFILLFFFYYITYVIVI